MSTTLGLDGAFLEHRHPVPAIASAAGIVTVFFLGIGLVLLHLYYAMTGGARPFLIIWLIIATLVPPILAEKRDAIHPDRNPFWKHASAGLFLAQRDGTPVGPITARNSQLSPNLSTSSLPRLGGDSITTRDTRVVTRPEGKLDMAYATQRGYRTTALAIVAMLFAALLALPAAHSDARGPAGLSLRPGLFAGSDVTSTGGGFSLKGTTGQSS
mgnify:CR=1 FL=1